MQYVEKRYHRLQQDLIAGIAGRLGVGQVATWQISHSIPLEPNERGRVTVSRLINVGSLQCKEIVFSVDALEQQATASAFVGVGIMVDGAVSAAVNYTFRTLHQAQQDHIATQAGALGVGESRAWAIKNSIPYGNEHGQVRLVREIGNPLARCRAVLFSVESPQARWFSGNICQHSNGQWKWASAEPATLRWGSLH
ncbi:MAG: hypothetical protein WAT67_03910 [Candidatus Contendobacter sp.]